MIFKSIKFKITAWYTILIILVFGAVLGSAFVASEQYSETDIRDELEDEVQDLQEDMMRYPDYFPGSDLITYYDDDVMLSIYDETFQFLNGIVPDDFPVEVAFTQDEIQRVTYGDHLWFHFDKPVELNDGTVYWIRGIHSFGAMSLMFRQFIHLLSFLIPFLVLFTAFVGYRMIRKSLLPIHRIAHTAKEISASSDLSKRLEVPVIKDEMHYLTTTFNEMLGTLEQNFHREKQFSSDAAHELRTPVSVILSHCEYCLEELNLSDESRKELEIIKQKSLQMSSLVSQLLSIARQENHPYTPDFEAVDLQILAESVIEELEEKASAKDIRISVTNQLSSPIIQGDMELLTRMFINLLENAITYGKKHGFAHIYMEETETHIRLRFEDNGIGISEDSIDRIWDRFYREDKSRSVSEGFGLGLFIVKHIVNCHKGEISVKSKLSFGTTFTVLLPKNPA